MDEYFLRDSKPNKEEDQKKLVLYFGNPLENDDKFALEIGSLLKSRENLLKHFRFIECLKPEDFFEELTSDDVIVLDVALEITDVMVLDDPDLLAYDKIHCAHQQNLSFYLKLFKILGDIDKISIIAIPLHGDTHQTADKVEKRLTKFIKA